MLNGIVAAGFKNVVEADDVRLYVRVGVRDRVAHTRLRRKIHDDLGLVLRENTVDQRLVCEVTLDESVFNRAGRGNFFDLCKAVLLQRDVVVVIHTVEADDVPGREIAQKARNEVCANESGRAGDEDCFGIECNILICHMQYPYV